MTNPVLLYTDNELYAMSMNDLALILDAYWKLTNAHKNYMWNTHNYSDDMVNIDSDLVGAWCNVSQVYGKRYYALLNCWQAVYTAAKEQKIETEKSIARMVRAVSVLAHLSDTDNLTAQDLWSMCDYANDVIYDNSENVKQDSAAFNKEYFRQETNKSRVRVCRKWCNARWIDGKPQFARSK